MHEAEDNNQGKGTNFASQAGKREPAGSTSGEHDPNAAGNGPRWLPLLESLICQNPKYLTPLSLQFKEKLKYSNACQTTFVSL